MVCANDQTLAERCRNASGTVGVLLKANNADASPFIEMTTMPSSPYHEAKGHVRAKVAESKNSEFPDNSILQ